MAADHGEMRGICVFGQTEHQIAARVFGHAKPFGLGALGQIGQCFAFLVGKGRTAHPRTVAGQGADVVEHVCGQFGQSVAAMVFHSNTPASGA